MSLDGFIEDEHGCFDWTQPDDEQFAFITDLIRRSSFDPNVIREMKGTASRDLMVGGADLAAHAFNARLIEECHLFIGPAVLGRGKPALPSELRAELELLDERRFDNGVVYVRHRIAI